MKEVQCAHIPTQEANSQTPTNPLQQADTQTYMPIETVLYTIPEVMYKPRGVGLPDFFFEENGFVEANLSGQKKRTNRHSKMVERAKIEGKKLRKENASLPDLVKVFGPAMVMTDGYAKPIEAFDQQLEAQTRIEALCTSLYDSTYKDRFLTFVMGEIQSHVITSRFAKYVTTMNSAFEKAESKKVQPKLMPRVKKQIELSKKEVSQLQPMIDRYPI